MVKSAWVVLVIEDVVPTRRFLKKALEGRGFKLLEAVTGTQGLAIVACDNPDIILLDRGLPDIDGLEVIRRVREWGTYSLIVISARGRKADKVDELDTGADDYLTKPFGVDDLTARLRVAVWHLTQSRVGKAEPIVQPGELRVDLAGRMVWVGGEEIHLTPIEFKLLAILELTLPSAP
jgi:two-component system KDP operon response regulator KdpE